MGRDSRRCPVGLSCAAFRAPESFFYSVPQGDVRGLTLPWAGDLGPFGAHSRLFETVKRIKFRERERPQNPQVLLSPTSLGLKAAFIGTRVRDHGSGIPWSI